MESFESIYSYWRNSIYSLKWNCLFVLPHWLKIWWEIFGSTSEIYLCAIRQADDVLGIAPLMLESGNASFIGNVDVCDYQDFIIAPAKGNEFFSVLLDYLSQKGITLLDLKPLRPDSTTLLALAEVARKRGCEVSCKALDVSFELNLPASWDEYLLMLNGKQRHEIRRKLRRLQEAGNITYRVVEEVKDVNKEMETFFTLFKSSSADKETFMTDKMASFFRSMAETMAAEKMFKLYLLAMNEKPIAAVMCFDYNSRVYLYNNGFDINFRSLSVGILCKVFSIKDCIQKDKEKYDFLKGSETYKYRLGGKEIPLYECKVKINS